MNHLWFGKSLKEAIATPVVFVNSENAVKFEPNFDEVNHCIMYSFGEATLHTVFHLSRFSSLPSECNQGSESSGTQK